MKLSAAAFLTDENIHPNVSACLRALGNDVVTVIGSELAGSDDISLLDLARTNQRVILTHDADFGTLAIAAGRPIFGIVYLRPGHISPDYTVGSLQTLFEQVPDVDTPFMIVVKRSGDIVNIRVRRLQRPQASKRV